VYTFRGVSALQNSSDSSNLIKDKSTPVIPMGNWRVLGKTSFHIRLWLGGDGIPSIRYRRGVGVIL